MSVTVPGYCSNVPSRYNIEVFVGYAAASRMPTSPSFVFLRLMRIDIVADSFVFLCTSRILFSLTLQNVALALLEFKDLCEVYGYHWQGVD